ICLKWSNVSLGVTVITAILARSDYQLIKIQWFAKQIPGGSRLQKLDLIIAEIADLRADMGEVRSEATAVAAASGDFVPLKVLRLVHAQTIHVLPGVFERCYPIAITAAAAGSGRIAVERPETRDRKTVGDHKRVNRVDVLQAGNFILGISPPDHHCDSDMVEGNTGLLVESLRRCNGGFPHVTEVVDHHAVVRVRGAIVKRHEVDDVITSQAQPLDLIDDRGAGASACNRIG